MAAASPYIRPQLREAPSSNLWVLVAFALFAFAGGLGYALAYGEMQAFFVAASLVAALAVLFDFRIGVVLLVLIMPIGATQLFPYGLMGVPGLNPTNLLIIATTLAFLMRGGRIRELAPAPVLWLMVVPVVLSGLLGMTHFDEIASYFFENDAVIFTNAFGYFQQYAFRPMLLVAMAMLLAVAVARSQKPERFIVPMMISVWLIALIELGFIAWSGVRLGYLATPGARTFYDEIGIHANDLGRLFAVAYGVLLFVWWEAKSGPLKTALFFTVGISAVAMVLTFSRGAFLGFFIVNGLFLLWKFNAKTVGLALLAGSLTAIIAPGYLWSRLTFGFDSDLNAVSADRIDGIWLPLLPGIWESPIWGQGLASTLWSAPMRAGSMVPAGHPHNAYLEAVLDMGFVGLALLLFFYWLVWRGFRSLGSNAFLSPEMRGLFQGASAALVCFLVTGGTGSSLRPEPEFGFIWLAIGMMYGMLARKPGA